MTTILSRLHDHARRRGEAPAYYRKVDGQWQATNWSECEQQVRRAARALLALGLAVGDTVGILAANRPEWTIGALAAMAGGGAPVGIYTTSSPEQVRYVVDHAESRIVLLDTTEQWAKLEQVGDQRPRLRNVVLMDQSELPEDPSVLGWDAFLAHADGVPEAELEERLRAIGPDQIGTLVYTSGTTGPPKGVMLSHSNLVATARMGLEVFGQHLDYSSISYLPLAHVAEQMFTVHMPVFVGWPVYYVESFETLAEDLREIQPTVFFGVPRVWERIHAGVTEKVAAASGFRRRLFNWALRVGARVNSRQAEDLPPGPWLAAQHALSERLVASKVRERLGFSRARVPASGAAPIATEILEFFAALGLPIYEVYGQTESSGPATWNRPGHTRPGSVGPPLPGMDLRIAEDGEIQVRGPNVFQGYYKDPAATAETLVDGWLLTGDLGSVDEDGFVTITGRKKEIIITSGGKNIAPNNIEAALKRADLIAEAVVIGEGRRYLTALLTLNREALDRLAGALGPLSDVELADHPVVLDKVQEAVDDANRLFSRAERVRKFRVLAQDFTIEAGELTPTLKVRRLTVCDHFAEIIEQMYAE